MWRRFGFIAVMAALGGLSMSGAEAAPRIEQVAFSSIPGWAADDHLLAVAAFLRSCQGPPRAIREDWDAHRLAEESRGVETGSFEPRNALRTACKALESSPPADQAAARGFFEAYFTAHEVVPADDARKVTGYFEPLLPGARTRTERFRFPIHAKPANLVALTDANRPAEFPAGQRAALKTADGLVMPPDRRAIEAGTHGLTLEPIVWLDDPVDVYFVHIQGSARIALPDGRTLRLGYAGKNGHPYQSIGRAVVQRGLMALEDVTAESLKQWLRDNPETAAQIYPINPSYIFFRQISGLAESDGPIGAEGVPLTTGRTLAVDPRFHDYGTPIFVSGRLPVLPDGALESFNRLMVAQDTGSAIRGPVRGDIFTGTGVDAGVLAGMINHPVRFFVLLPRKQS
jgi:membrane-bound lytic murein transglycosylase A